MASTPIEYTGDYETEQIPLRYVPVAPLHELTRQLLYTSDLAPSDADIIAEALLTSELRNLQGQGQGVRRVRAYLDRVNDRLLDPDAPFEIVKESPALALVDAHNGAGHGRGRQGHAPGHRKGQGVRRRHGPGAPLHPLWLGQLLGQSGPARRLHRRQHDQCRPRDGALGRHRRRAGHQPLGRGDAHRRRGPDDMPIILDMATHHGRQGYDALAASATARRCPRTGPLPGRRVTDDPAAAMDGTLLPMGEYKGYGLSLITDVLTGVMGGGAFGSRLHADPARRMWATSSSPMISSGSCRATNSTARLAEFIEMVKGSGTRPDVTEILLPGELEWRRMQEKKQSGVPVDPEIYEELRGIGGRQQRRLAVRQLSRRPHTIWERDND